MSSEDFSGRGCRRVLPGEKRKAFAPGRELHRPETAGKRVSRIIVENHIGREKPAKPPLPFTRMPHSIAYSFSFCKSSKKGENKRGKKGRFSPLFPPLPPLFPPVVFFISSFRRNGAAPRSGPWREGRSSGSIPPAKRCRANRNNPSSPSARRRCPSPIWRRPSARKGRCSG